MNTTLGKLANGSMFCFGHNNTGGLRYEALETSIYSRSLADGKTRPNATSPHARAESDAIEVTYLGRAPAPVPAGA